VKKNVNTGEGTDSHCYLWKAVSEQLVDFQLRSTCSLYNPKREGDTLRVHFELSSQMLEVRHYEWPHNLQVKSLTYG